MAQIVTCLNYILYGFIADSSLKMILSIIQLYSLTRIMLLTRKNKQRMRDACWVNVTYILIIILQTIMNISLLVSSYRILMNLRLEHRFGMM